MKLSCRAREALLLNSVALLIGITWLLQPLAQDPEFHHFADQRAWGPVTFAMDVLSNLPFALWGWVGLAALWRWWSTVQGAQRPMLILFFTGLVATAVGSSWYHLNPTDASLAIDRWGMSVAFAGLMGLAVATRVSERTGNWAGPASFVLGVISVWVWRQTGNLTPWAVYQFGGMALMLGLLWLPRLPGALPVNWLAVLVIYGVAKCFESADHWVFEATGGLSGHSLKHLVASLAAWPVLSALRRHAAAARP